MPTIRDNDAMDGRGIALAIGLPMRNGWFTLGMLVGLGCVGVAAGCGGQRETAAPAKSSSPVAALDSKGPIDTLIDAAWTTAGKTPVAEVDDPTFLRRVSLDLLGRAPTVLEVRLFAADKAADKRARLVETLLDRPEHARHLARMWERTLMGPEVKNRFADRGAMKRWLEEKFASDAPWDTMVREVVAAEGKSSVGGGRAAQMGAEDPERASEEKADGVNGATNYTLRFGNSPTDLAGTTSRVFLGVQIQCAQCHDHKTESWKQSDFREFAATFTHLKANPLDRDKGQIPVYEITSSKKPDRRVTRATEPEIIAASPRALDDTSLDGDNPRASLAQWMTTKDNAWFSRAMVNRVWSELMGQGFVEPIDDFRPSNPAIMPEVLDALAEDFEAHGFDLDHLYATICATRAYALDLGGGAESPRAASFSHQALRPLSSDQLLDSIFAATEADKLLDARTPARAELIKAAIRRRMSFVFESDSESNADAYDGTLQQALFAMNGSLPMAATAVKEDAFLADLVAKSSDSVVVTELYLRTLGREPSVEELAAARTFVAADRGQDPGVPRAGKKDKKVTKPKKVKGSKAGVATDPAEIVSAAVRSDAETDRERGAEDLFWALINSSEFGFRK